MTLILDIDFKWF